MGDVLQIDPKDMREIGSLMRDYSAGLGFSLAYQDFEKELAQLPGEYAPPNGALVIARLDGTSAGMVALRRLEEGVCEMKRLYVRPSFTQLKIGRVLAITVIERARMLGYQRMRLDTVRGVMDVAIRLYQTLGFREIEPYYASPIEGDVFYGAGRFRIHCWSSVVGALAVTTIRAR